MRVTRLLFWRVNGEAQRKETYAVDGSITEKDKGKIYEIDRGIWKIMVGIAFIDVVAPKGAVCWARMQSTYARSPRIRRANWMSFGIMVTRLAWMAHKLVSSNRPTR